MLSESESSSEVDELLESEVEVLEGDALSLVEEGAEEVRVTP